MESLELGVGNYCDSELYQGSEDWAEGVRRNVQYTTKKGKKRDRRGREKLENAVEEGDYKEDEQVHQKEFKKEKKRKGKRLETLPIESELDKDGESLAGADLLGCTMGLESQGGMEGNETIPAATLAEAINNTSKRAKKKEEKRREPENEAERDAVESSKAQGELALAQEAQSPSASNHTVSKGLHYEIDQSVQNNHLYTYPPSLEIPSATQLVSISSVSQPPTRPTSAYRSAANPFEDSKLARGSKNRSEHDVKEMDDRLRERFKDPKEMLKWLASASLGKTELARLEKEGIVTYKKGKFTEDEKTNIRRALDMYQKANRMDQFALVELVMTKTNQATDRETVRDFWRDIAFSVPGRPILNLQPFVRRMLDPKAHKGKWTSEEDALLLRAYEQYPRLWSKISTIVNRTEVDCRDRYLKELVNRDGRSTGRWTKEEEDKLLAVVRKVMRDLGVREGEDGDVEIPWDIISREMGNRSITQCRIKWRDGLAPSNHASRVKDDYKTIKVISRLKSMGYQSENHIIWSDVQDESLEGYKPKEIRNAYSNMKRTLTKDSQCANLPFPKLLDVMYEKALTPRKRGLWSKGGPTNTSKEIVDESGDEA
nr:hypothetical protein L203_00712 [Cryptococcus depauperatus CBS 7841]